LPKQKETAKAAL